jgi:hypothetical protein
MRSIGILVIAAALLVAGPTQARKPITPKAGGYVGKVTNKNGTGEVKLLVATFRTSQGDKKGPELFSWAGRFTSSTKLKGTARVTSKDCDTGPVTFKAHYR